MLINVPEFCPADSGREVACSLPGYDPRWPFCYLLVALRVTWFLFAVEDGGRSLIHSPYRLPVRGRAAAGDRELRTAGRKLGKSWTR